MSHTGYRVLNICQTASGETIESEHYICPPLAQSPEDAERIAYEADEENGRFHIQAIPGETFPIEE